MKNARLLNGPHPRASSLVSTCAAIDEHHYDVGRQRNTKVLQLHLDDYPLMTRAACNGDNTGWQGG